jgi:hypothetical protein
MAQQFTYGPSAGPSTLSATTVLQAHGVTTSQGDVILAGRDVHLHVHYHWNPIAAWNPIPRSIQLSSLKRKAVIVGCGAVGKVGWSLHPLFFSSLHSSYKFLSKGSDKGLAHQTALLDTFLTGSFPLVSYL